MDDTVQGTFKVVVLGEGKLFTLYLGPLLDFAMLTLEYFYSKSRQDFNHRSVLREQVQRSAEKYHRCNLPRADRQNIGSERSRSRPILDVQACDMGHGRPGVTPCFKYYLLPRSARSFDSIRYHWYWLVFEDVIVGQRASSAMWKRTSHRDRWKQEWPWEQPTNQAPGRWRLRTVAWSPALQCKCQDRQQCQGTLQSPDRK